MFNTNWMITNNENSGAFSNLSSGSSNFHYQKNYWNKIMQQNYSSHASYKSIIPDVVSSVLSDAI